MRLRQLTSLVAHSQVVRHQHALIVVFAAGPKASVRSAVMLLVERIMNCQHHTGEREPEARSVPSSSP